MRANPLATSRTSWCSLIKVGFFTRNRPASCSMRSLLSDRSQLLVPALAAAVPEGGRADALLRSAKLLVQGEQLLVERGDQGSTGGPPLVELGLDGRDLRGRRSHQLLGPLPGHFGVGPRRGEPLLQVLPLLHQLEETILHARLPTLDALDLRA